MKIIQLWIEFFKIGAFSFGGGLAALPYIYNLVEKTGWSTKKEIINILTLSQLTPGPLACNIATYIGFRQNGILGGLVSTISFILPSIIFMGIIYKILNKFKTSKTVNFILKVLRASAVAIILASSLEIFKITFLNTIENINNSFLIYNINYKNVILVIILVPLVKHFKLSTLKSIGIATILGLIINFL